jgi:hypothetical protein
MITVNLRPLAVALISAGLISSCTSPSPKSAPASSTATITIDEEMYDAPEMAKEICKGSGHSGAVLLESREGKSTFKCAD